MVAFFSFLLPLSSFLLLFFFFFALFFDLLCLISLCFSTFFAFLLYVFSTLLALFTLCFFDLLALLILLLFFDRELRPVRSAPKAGPATSRTLGALRAQPGTSAPTRGTSPAMGVLSVFLGPSRAALAGVCATPARMARTPSRQGLQSAPRAARAGS